MKAPDQELLQSLTAGIRDPKAQTGDLLPTSSRLESESQQTTCTEDLGDPDNQQTSASGFTVGSGSRRQGDWYLPPEESQCVAVGSLLTG